MVRGLFVTGTDTGVGKTVVSAALMHRYRAAGPLTYWKPIQTGSESDDDTAEVTRLGECEPDEIFGRGIRLPLPVSPHLAARETGTTIQIGPLLEAIGAESGERRWIVEGAGGVLVPLNDTALMIDLAAALAMPVVIAARTTIGTINHTLLTLEALRRRELPIAGVVLVGDANDDNRASIERYGDVTVLGVMPRFDHLTPVTLAAWSLTELDPDDVLLELLQ